VLLLERRLDAFERLASLLFLLERRLELGDPVLVLLLLLLLPVGRATQRTSRAVRRWLGACVERHKRAPLAQAQDVPADAQQGLDFAEQLPPRPVVELNEDDRVLLNDPDGLLLAVGAAVPAAGQVALRGGLEA